MVLWYFPLLCYHMLCAMVLAHVMVSACTVVLAWVIILVGVSATRSQGPKDPQEVIFILFSAHLSLVQACIQVIVVKKQLRRNVSIITDQLYI